MIFILMIAVVRTNYLIENVMRYWNLQQKYSIPRKSHGNFNIFSLKIYTVKGSDIFTVDNRFSNNVYPKCHPNTVKIVQP